MNTTRTLCALALLAAPAAALTVIHVPGNYAHVTTAVNAAADGDVILIAPGNYPESPVIDGKSLVLQGLPGGTVHLRQLSILDLAPSQNVLVRGLNFDVNSFPGLGFGPLLRLADCGGAVRIEDVDAQFNAGTGSQAAIITDCASVVLRGCKLRGTGGITIDDHRTQIGEPTDGSSALDVIDSTVATFACTMLGGTGGDANDGGYSGGSGGAGIRSTTSHLFVSGGTATGGAGGHYDCNINGCGSPGGPAPGVLEFFGPGTTWLRDATLVGGSSVEGTANPFGTLNDDAAVRFEADYRDFHASSPATSGGTLSLVFQGQPGDGLLLLASPSFALDVKPAYEGPLLLGLDCVQIPFGSLPDAAPFTVSAAVPPLPAGLQALVVPLQAVFVAGGQALLGPASSTVLLAPGA